MKKKQGTVKGTAIEGKNDTKKKMILLKRIFVGSVHIGSVDMYDSLIKPGPRPGYFLISIKYVVDPTRNSKILSS